MSSISDALAGHLASLGYVVDADGERVRDAMLRHAGAERFAEYMACAIAPVEERQARLTAFPRDIIEANLLRSVDVGVTLAASHHLYALALPHLRSGITVLELGCWTGALASFVASRHRELSVVGVDHAAHILHMARRHFSLPNLKFVEWDYRRDKPEDVPRVDILLCSLGIDNPPRQYGRSADALRPRENDTYRWWSQVWGTYFRQWRSAAKDGATLLIVHRLSTLPQIFAFVDVAHGAGWSADLNDVGRVVVSACDLVLPSMTFKATASPVPQLDEDDVIARWVWAFQRDEPYLQTEGPVAVALYRALNDRRVLGARDVEQDNGLLIREEVGSAGAVSYLFRWDAQLGVKLIVFSHPDANRLLRAWQRAEPHAALATPSHMGPNHCHR